MRKSVMNAFVTIFFFNFVFLVICAAILLIYFQLKKWPNTEPWIPAEWINGTSKKGREGA